MVSVEVKKYKSRLRGQIHRKIHLKYQYPNSGLSLRNVEDAMIFKNRSKEKMLRTLRDNVSNIKGDTLSSL